MSHSPPGGQGAPVARGRPRLPEEQLTPAARRQRLCRQRQRGEMPIVSVTKRRPRLPEEQLTPAGERQRLCRQRQRDKTINGPDRMRKIADRRPNNQYKSKALQEKLFIPDERNELFRIWSSPLENPNSHFAELAATGKHIFTGRPASPYRDYKYVSNDKELEAALACKPKLILYDDLKWYNERPNKTTCTRFMSEIEDYGIIEIQDFGNEKSELVAEMPMDNFQRRWNESGGKLTQKPMNALNISAANYECTPRALLKSHSLLHELTERVGASNVVSEGMRVDPEAPDTEAVVAPAVVRTVSKRSTKNREVAADTEGCLRFQILSQAGCFSGWHMDMLAPFTWVTLEGDEDETPLKYWAVISMDHLDAEDQTQILAEFAREGANWKPRSDLIAVVSLTRGMTLIMPPGTIHAPISMTNCLFRGGMCWGRQSFCEYILPNFEFILGHRGPVTNEDPHKQVPDILKMASEDIQKRYTEYGLDHTNVSDVKQRVALVATMAKPCRCKKACGSKCKCASKNHKCSRHCTCRCKDK